MWCLEQNFFEIFLEIKIQENVIDYIKKSTLIQESDIKVNIRAKKTELGFYNKLIAMNVNLKEYFDEDSWIQFFLLLNNINKLFFKLSYLSLFERTLSTVMRKKKQ